MKKTVIITTPFIRLDALLKFTGLVQTGGEAKIRVLNREVKINGEVCDIRGKKCRTGDQVQMGDAIITIADGP